MSDERLSSEEAAALVAEHSIVAITAEQLATVTFELGNGQQLELTESNPGWDHERSWALLEAAG